MKKVILTLLVIFSALNLFAQETLTAQDSNDTQETVAFRFGCISYNQVLESMPEYAKAESDISELKAKYDTEMKASEDEFNAKYETFLSEQSNYAPSILRKRQSELEDMMKRNEQFRLESLHLLDNAKAEMIKHIREKLDAAIRQIASEYKLAFVLNTDSEAVPYLNIDMAFNITNAVQEAVKE